jgi:hypothetical protein
MDQIDDRHIEKGSDRCTWSYGFDGGRRGVLHGDNDEAVLRLVEREEVVEHPLHRLCCLGREQPRATPRRRAASVASLHIVVERERPGYPALVSNPVASRSRDRERTREERGSEREWTGENQEREKNLASRTMCGTVQRESTRSMYHFWMLVIGQRREVRIDLILVADVLCSRYKK